MSSLIYCLGSPLLFRDTEFYDLSFVSHKGIITRINQFKSINPDYLQINRDSFRIDERTDSYGKYCYNCFFYFADINQSVHCIIINNTTRIGLVSVSDSTYGYLWTRINTMDLSTKENRNIKEKFEKEILNQLGFSWKRTNKNAAGWKRFFSFLERYLLFTRRSYDLLLYM